MGKSISYTEENIRSLDWREHIRLRPGMYIGKLGDGSSPDDGIYILVKEINEGGYRQINRYWEATPTEICEAAVDEISKFVLDPTSYKDVMENLQTLADNYWSNN